MFTASTFFCCSLLLDHCVRSNLILNNTQSKIHLNWNLIIRNEEQILLVRWKKWRWNEMIFLINAVYGTSCYVHLCFIPTFVHLSMKLSCSNLKMQSIVSKYALLMLIFTFFVRLFPMLAGGRIVPVNASIIRVN